jgi:hypothetical protein
MKSEILESIKKVTCQIKSSEHTKQKCFHRRMLKLAGLSSAELYHRPVWAYHGPRSDKKKEERKRYLTRFNE